MNILDEGGMLRIPIEVAGKEMIFVVDTGSEITIFDEAHRSELGQPIENALVNTATATQSSLLLYPAPEMAVGGAQANLPNVACHDLAMIKMVNGGPCDGVLGMDFMQNHVITFDLDSRTFGVADHVNESVKRSAEIVPLVRVATRQQGFQAILNKTRSVTLMIDTGDNGSITLRSEDWNELFGADKAKIHSTLMFGMKGSTTQISMGRLDSATIGKTSYADLLCFLSPNTTSASGIGTRFLRRHIATFDFPKHLLYLEPSKHFHDEDHIDMSGLHLLRKDGTTFAFAVDGGSPAEAAGIKSGSIIRLIDGADSKSLTMREIREILRSEDGRHVKIEFAHQGEVHGVELILKKVL